MPSRTRLLVSLDEKASGAWKVAKAGVEEYLPDGRLVPALVEVPVPTVRENGPTEVTLKGLFDGPRYRVTIYIEATGDEFEHDIGGRTPKNADEIKRKYQVIAEKACGDLNARGGISIKLG
jgi:hypothetical protein